MSYKHTEVAGGSIFDYARRVINRRWYLIPVTTAVVVGIMLGYIYMFPPIYRTNIRVLVEDTAKSDEAVTQFYANLQIFRRSELPATDAELMKANEILDEVVRKLDLKYDDVYHSFLTNVLDIWRRSWVREQYKKIKHLFIPERPLPLGVTEEDIEHIGTIKGLKSGIGFESLQGSSVYKVSVKGPSPRVAMMANVLMESYMARRLERHTRTARGVREEIRERMEATKKKLDEAAKSFQRYAEEEEIIFDFEKERANVAALKEREMALEGLRRNKKGMEEKLKKIEEEKAKLERRVPSMG